MSGLSAYVKSLGALVKGSRALVNGCGVPLKNLRALRVKGP